MIIGFIAAFAIAGYAIGAAAFIIFSFWALHKWKQGRK